MSLGRFKFGSFPTFLCLIAGLSCSLIFLCYDRAPDHLTYRGLGGTGGPDEFFITESSAKSQLRKDNAAGSRSLPTPVATSDPNTQSLTAAEQNAVRVRLNEETTDSQQQQTATQDPQIRSSTLDRQALSKSSDSNKEEQPLADSASRAQQPHEVDVSQDPEEAAALDTSLADGRRAQPLLGADTEPQLPRRQAEEQAAVELAALDLAGDDPDDQPELDTLEDGQDQGPGDQKNWPRQAEGEGVRADVETAEKVAANAEPKPGEDAVTASEKTASSKLADGAAKDGKNKPESKHADVDLEREQHMDPEPKSTGSKSISIAELAQAAAKDLQDAESARKEGVEGLSATEKKFMFQMTDMLDMAHGQNDQGGASLKMDFLTEEEANALDAEEYNSLKAYGARDQDLVTFLQVRQGMPKVPHEERQAKLQAAAEGVPLLTIDIVKQQAVDNLVIVTFANWAYYDFALNWVAHLRKLGVTNFLVGALDRQTSLGLSVLGIPGFKMYPGGEGAAGLTTQDFRPNQENFHRLSRQKVALARLFTDFGYDVVLNDVDSVWLRDPTPFFSQFQDADMLTASDNLSSSLRPGDEGLELVHAIQGTLSISVLYVRHSAAVTAFVKEWDAVLAGQVSRVDQIAFNTLVAQYTDPLSTPVANPRLATGPTQRITVGVLPAAGFMNGHTYFVQGLHKEYRSKPYCVHVNFNEGGIRGKRHRLREAGLWADTPSYFEAPNGFVQVLLEPIAAPYRTLSEDEMLRFHTRSLNQQLVQVRAGVALAVALEKTLILPKIMCFCDRSWVGLERCRAPGAAGLNIPFVCPLDYVWDPGHFDDAAKEHGPRIDIREHNFLDRAELPSTVKESMVAVVPSGLSFSRFLSQSFPAKIPQVQVEAPLRDRDLRQSLEAQLAVSVLAFTDAAQTFGGFQDPDWATAVAKRLAWLQGTWCCGRGDERSMIYSMESSVAGLTAV